MRILVVEDEPKMAGLIRRVLVAERHVVDVAPDGVSAIALAEGAGLRRDRPRPDAARRRRPDRPPPAAPEGRPDAGAAAHRARLGRGAGRRARRRRRRLPAEAVLVRRARRPDPRARPATGRARPRRASSPATSSSTSCAMPPRSATGRSTCPRANSPCSATSSATPARSSPGTRSSTPSGARSRTSTRTSSTCTSTTCAASSASSTGPTGCGRSAASATPCGPARDRRMTDPTAAAADADPPPALRGHPRARRAAGRRDRRGDGGRHAPRARRRCRPCPHRERRRGRRSARTTAFRRAPKRPATARMPSSASSDTFLLVLDPNGRPWSQTRPASTSPGLPDEAAVERRAGHGSRHPDGRRGRRRGPAAHGRDRAGGARAAPIGFVQGGFVLDPPRPAIAEHRRGDPARRGHRADRGGVRHPDRDRTGASSRSAARSRPSAGSSPMRRTNCGRRPRSSAPTPTSSSGRGSWPTTGEPLVADIITEADRLGRLVGDLLQLAADRRDRASSSSPRPVDLGGDRGATRSARPRRSRPNAASTSSWSRRRPRRRPS